jgi:hypothetical protein
VLPTSYVTAMSFAELRFIGCLENPHVADVLVFGVITREYDFMQCRLGAFFPYDAQELCLSSEWGMVRCTS